VNKQTANTNNTNNTPARARTARTVPAATPRSEVVVRQVEEMLASTRKPTSPTAGEDGMDWCAVWARYDSMRD
jgi:hypothetical protein